jgi:hypothetical protein
VDLAERNLGVISFWLGIILFFSGVVIGVEFFSKRGPVKMKVGDTELQAASVRELIELMDTLKKRNNP